MSLTLAPCMESHQGASQFKFSPSGKAGKTNIFVLNQFGSIERAAIVPYCKTYNIMLSFQILDETKINKNEVSNQKTGIFLQPTFRCTSRPAGGKLQLALNHDLCAEAHDSGLRLGKCAKNRPRQDFILNRSLTVGGDRRCVMASRSHTLKLGKSCGFGGEVEAMSTGCEHIVHPHIDVSSDEAQGCPRQIKWSYYRNLCIGTMAWHVGHGQSIVLSTCDLDLLIY